MPKNETQSAGEDAVQKSQDDHVGADRELSATTQIVTAHHSPGAPLEVKEDGESSREFEAELAKADDEDSAPLPVEYDQAGIDSRSPEANVASRSNIVANLQNAPELAEERAREDHNLGVDSVDKRAILARDDDD